MTKAGSKVNKSNMQSFRERNRNSGGYLMKKKAMNVGISIARFILLFGMCFMIIQPVLNKISLSFMKEADIYNPIVISIPSEFSTENYTIAWNAMNYGKGIINTVIFSIALSVLQVAMCTLVGYGFARFEFPLKKFWFGCVMMMLLIPPQTISTSLYLHFRFFDVLGIIKLLTGNTVNLRNSPLPYFLMSAGCTGLKNGLYIFLIRQFFRNLPGDLEEAAYVDGLGTFRTFVQIMLPEAKPIITSCFLFAFVWQWTDGFYSRMFLGGRTLLSTSLAALPDSLTNFILRMNGQTSGTVATGYINMLVSTGTLMVILPLIVLYLFAQKAFVESISSTGIKM